MDTVPGLKELQERKRELLLESDLNRHVLRVEFGRVHYRVERFRRGYDWAHSAWAWAGPVAAFLLARRFKKTAGVVAKGSVLVGALRALWKAWESRRSQPSAADAERSRP